MPSLSPTEVYEMERKERAANGTPNALDTLVERVEALEKHVEWLSHVASHTVKSGVVHVDKHHHEPKGLR